MAIQYKDYSLKNSYKGYFNSTHLEHQNLKKRDSNYDFYIFNFDIFYLDAYQHSVNFIILFSLLKFSFHYILSY